MSLLHSETGSITAGHIADVAKKVADRLSGPPTTVKGDVTAARINLDPRFIESVESFTPLDLGVGRIAAAAVIENGADRLVAHGVHEQLAPIKVKELAKELQATGYQAAHEAEPLDFMVHDSKDTLDEIMPKLSSGQIAETLPLPPNKLVKSGWTEIVRVFEPSNEAADARVDDLEKNRSVYGLEAQVTLEALAVLANEKPYSLDGAQAAHFLQNMNPTDTHVRLG